MARKFAEWGRQCGHMGRRRLQAAWGRRWTKQAGRKPKKRDRFTAVFCKAGCKMLDAAELANEQRHRKGTAKRRNYRKFKVFLQYIVAERGGAGVDDPPRRRVVLGVGGGCHGRG